MARAGSDHIDAVEATRLLQIKKATLYAYVSRGLIRAYQREGERAKFYSRDDVERLRARVAARSGHGAVAAGALRWGEPVLDSAITRIDSQGPSYRGYLAIRLAERLTPFENVCELLWSGLLPASDVLWQPLTSPPEMPLLRESPLRFQDPNLFVSKLMSYAISHYGFAQNDVGLYDESTRHVRDLMQLIASQLFLLRKGAQLDEWSDAKPLAATLADALMTRPNRRAIQLINTGLILSADHELTPSTFAARVAASTGADFFSCLSSAAGALSGPRHGGVFVELERISQQLAEKTAGQVLQTLRKREDELPGFAHSLYAREDPRASLLLREIAEESYTRPAYRRWQKFIDKARDQGYGEPSIDTALMLLAHGLGLPHGSAGAIFALGRMAGWTAHIIEQRLSGFMVRPRARYTGR